MIQARDIWQWPSRRAYLDARRLYRMGQRAIKAVGHDDVEFENLSNVRQIAWHELALTLVKDGWRGGAK